uniref:Uncharacterized protein n=1 Tax=Oryza brachyantha TaxID=4533 RepID=J3L4Q3_ORYBR
MRNQPRRKRTQQEFFQRFVALLVCGLGQMKKQRMEQVMKENKNVACSTAHFEAVIQQHTEQPDQLIQSRGEEKLDWKNAHGMVQDSQYPSWLCTAHNKQPYIRNLVTERMLDGHLPELVQQSTSYANMLYKIQSKSELLLPSDLCRIVQIPKRQGSAKVPPLLLEVVICIVAGGAGLWVDR